MRWIRLWRRLQRRSDKDSVRQRGTAKNSEGQLRAGRGSGWCIGNQELRGWFRPALRCSSLLLAALGCFGCKSVPPPVPLDQLNAQQARGHAVYQARCAVCHYDRRNDPLHGPALVGVFKKPYLPSGAPANDERVTATVLYGRNLMPAMGNVVDAQDLDDLLAYLHTL